MGKDQIASISIFLGSFVRTKGLSVKHRKVPGTPLQKESSTVLGVLLILVKFVEIVEKSKNANLILLDSL
jgi:hypothetical protein